MQKWVGVHSGSVGTEYVCVATYLPLKKRKYLLAFMLMALRIEGQLKRTPGLMAYGLRADLFRNRFWTLSLWADRAAMNGFVPLEPHRMAIQRFERWAGQGAAFVEWKQSGPRPGWEEALKRLKTPTFYYQTSTSAGATAKGVPGA
jgi:hypothetical protein